MIEVFNCDQGSPEWHEVRRGIPTASEFECVLASGRGGGESKTRRKYMLTLIAEQITGEVVEGYTNAHMERGKAMEGDAREMYAFMKDVEPQRVGFVRNGNVGCSPDSLIGDKGLLEIKTRLPYLQVDVLLTGKVPPEHKPQLQGELWVCEREWIDFAAYWPRLPLFVRRVYRDEPYIKALAQAVDAFRSEMHDLAEKVMSYKAAA